MADRLVILRSGRVVLQGTPHALTSGGGADPVIAFGAPPALEAASLAAAVGPGTVVTETSPGRYRVEGPSASGPAATAAVANWLAERGAALTDLTAGRSLEDVYFAAVGAEGAAAAEPSDADAPSAGAARRRRRSR
jgi:ABC-2 type transport system ATP-binding protein